jgi:hypothetical protein
MQNTEWIDMLRVIPEEVHNQIVLVLNNRSEVAVDTFFRFESNFLVLRGRVAGTTDEARAFFIPYDQMVYYRIERVVNLIELQAIFDGLPQRSVAAQPEANSTTQELPSIPVDQSASQAPTTNGTPLTDATATRNALLDRIRAARTTQSVSNPRQASQ